MAYTFDVTRTIDAPTMEGLYENVKRQFKDPAISQQAIYHTPRGSFTVSMEVRDKTQFDAIFGIVMGAICPVHQQEETVQIEKPVKVTECKPTMKVTYESDFNDEAMKEILSRFVEQTNAYYTNGISSIICSDCNQHMAIIVNAPAPVPATQN